METLAGLAKSPRPGRTAEQEVGTLVDKTPEVHSASTVYHRSLGIMSLLGGSVPLNGKMLMAGRTIRSGKLLFGPEGRSEGGRRTQKTSGKLLASRRMISPYATNGVVR